MKLPIIIGVKRWVIFTSIICIHAAAMTYPLAAYLSRPHVTVMHTPEQPKPLPACGDEAFMIQHWERINCDARARLEISGNIAKCMCVHEGK